MILYAPAKINLHLSVFDKRPDGYHNIETVFERINILDKIIISSLPTNETKILSDHPELPLNRSGLIHRTVDALRDRTGVEKGVEIKILKNIPIAAGLGGGSSNAASVLMGLNKFWKLKFKKNELSDIGKRLGADIPFFLEESSFALAKNIDLVIYLLNIIFLELVMGYYFNNFPFFTCLDIEDIRLIIHCPCFYSKLISFPIPFQVYYKFIVIVNKT